MRMFGNKNQAVAANSSCLTNAVPLEEIAARHSRLDPFYYEVKNRSVHDKISMEAAEKRVRRNLLSDHLLMNPYLDHSMKNALRALLDLIP